MAPYLKMSKCSEQTEEELSLFLKDWLKQIGHTQAELGHCLNASSTRMSSIIEVLKKEFLLGGIPKIASRLCEIESSWSEDKNLISTDNKSSDPFDQLDLLLEEIKEDCDN